MTARNSTYSNTVKVEWLLLNKREMLILEPVVFTDAKGVEWFAGTGSIIDGASIPRLFWRIMGSPFVGKYRRASVIHDVYCKTKSRPHKQVHKMFYEAMRVDGVSKAKAKTMYNMVRTFGPRW